MLELLSAEVPTSRDHLEHELLRVRGEIEIRELYFSRLAAALYAMEIAEDIEAEQTPIDWLRINCRLTQQAAADRVHIGQKLPVMPQSENCLYTGEVGIQHLAVMARTAIAVGDGFDESRLLPGQEALARPLLSRVAALPALAAAPGSGQRAGEPGRGPLALDEHGRGWLPGPPGCP